MAPAASSVGGQFSEVQIMDTKYFLFILFEKKVPNPLANPPVVDAWDTHATLTWTPASDCLLSNVFVKVGNFYIPANNGQGVDLVVHTFTLISVRLLSHNSLGLCSYFFFSFFSSFPRNRTRLWYTVGMTAGLRRQARLSPSPPTSPPPPSPSPPPTPSPLA